MRKIESLMVQAISDRRCFSKGNTKVVIHHGNMIKGYSDYGKEEARVYLHGNHIATYDLNSKELKVSNAGWRTVTTKSRLNAIINGLLDGTKNGVYQKDHCWYVTDHGRDYDFDSSDWYSFKSNALDVTHTVTNSELVAV